MRLSYLWLVLIFLIPTVHANINDGLYWRISFDNDSISGSTFQDATENGSDFTFTNGVTQRAGILVDSYDVDGDGRVYGEHNYGISDFTLSIWVRAHDISSDQQRIWESGAVNENTLLIADTNTAYGDCSAKTLCFFDTSNTNEIKVAWNDAWDDVWTHIVVRCIGDSCTIFVNGAFQVGGTVSSRGTSTLPTTFGNNLTGTRTLQGYIDEACAWGRNITDTELSDLYNSGSGSPCESTAMEFVEASFNSTGGADLGNQTCIQDGNICYVTDSTPTFLLETTQTSNCTISLYGLNVSDALANNSDTECTTSEATTHTATLPASEELSLGLNTITISIMDTTTFENASRLLNVYLLNNAPTQGTPILNSTLGTNLSSEDLTVYPQNVMDTEGDWVINITSWRLINESYEILNLPFEGGSNTTYTKDYSEFGQNIVVNGASWNASNSSGGTGAYQFDGDEDYINITPVLSLLDRDQFSVAMWVYATTYTPSADNEGFFFFIGETGDGFGGEEEFHIGINHFSDTCNGIQISLHEDSDNIRNCIPIDLNTWYHVASTLDTATQNLSLYINGVLNISNISSLIGTADITTDDWDSAYIGSSGLTDRREFEGSVDDVYIFNRTLSAEQILSIYNGNLELSSEETSVGETWQACLTPNDGSEDGVETCSNMLEINGTSPTFNESLGDISIYLTQTLNITGNWSDAENDNAQVSINDSKIQVIITNNETHTYELYWEPSVEHTYSNWSFEITIDEGTLSNSQIFWVYVNESLPLVESVRISNEPTIYTNDPLNLEINVSEPLNEALSFNITWFTSADDATWVIHGTDNETWVSETGNSFTTSYLGDIEPSDLVDGVYWKAEVVVTDETNITYENTSSILVTELVDPYPLGNLYYTNGNEESAGDNMVYDGGSNNDATSNSFTISALERWDITTVTYETYHSDGDTVSGTVTFSDGGGGSFSYQQPTPGSYYTRSVSVAKHNRTNDNYNSEFEVTGGSPNPAVIWLQTSVNVTGYNYSDVIFQNVSLTSEDGMDSASENLTATLSDVTNIVGNPLKNISSWRLNRTTYELLNMPFENNDAKDYSSRGYSTIAGTSASWSSTGGHDGFGAYQFDGTNSLELPNFIPSETTNITWNVWFKADDVTTTEQQVFVYDADGLYLVTSINAGTEDLIRVHAGGKWSANTSSNDLTNWHMITGVAASGDFLRLYVDGVQVGSDITIGAFSDSGANSVMLGASGNLTTYANGTIDDVTIYNRTLSEEQIVSLYNENFELSSDETAINDGWTFCSIPVTIGSTKEDTQVCATLNVGAPAPMFDLLQISNTSADTNTFLNAEFQISSLEQKNLSINITWYSSTDNSTWTAHTTDDETWTDQTYATYNGITYNTSNTGDIEASDTEHWEYWLLSAVVTDGTQYTYQNSSSVWIVNEAPVQITNTSGTNHSSPVTTGFPVTFNVSGTDDESDTIFMRVCSNSDASWSSCALLCEDVTGVAWDQTETRSITCDFTTNETTRINTAYALLNDSRNFTTVVIDYTVNQYPVVENFSVNDTSGSEYLTYNESTDTFAIDWYDADNTTFLPSAFMTVIDPTGLYQLSNVSMNYTTPLTLNRSGNWTVQMYANDSDNVIDWYNTSFEVFGNVPVISAWSLQPNITGGNQTWEIEFNLTDADADAITECRLWVNDSFSNTTSTNNRCVFNISLNLNTSIQGGNFSGVDSATNHSLPHAFTLATITYDKIQSTSEVGNLSYQYFRQYWNITQNLANYTGVSFSYNSSDQRIINLTNGTTNDYTNLTTYLIEIGPLEFVEDVTDSYTVNGAETIFRDFNVTGTLHTGEDVPEFNITVEQQQYTSGAQSAQYQCGILGTYQNISTGQDFNITVFNVTNGGQECLRYFYKGTPIYAEGVVISSTSGDTTTYQFNDTQTNTTYGRKLSFLFSNLTTTAITLVDEIPYTNLTSFSSRDSVTQQVWRFTSPATYEKEVSGVDYTATADDSGETYTFTWASTNTPLTNLYMNLTWSLVSEEEEEEGGGGGGGGSQTTTTTLSLVGANPDLCDISFSEESLTFYNSDVKRITVTNNGSVSYSPEFSIEGGLEDKLSLTNSFTLLLPGESADFGIRFQTNSLTSGFATLSLIDTQCGVYTIEIRSTTAITPIVLVEDVFNDKESFLSFLSESVFGPDQEGLQEKLPFLTVGIFWLILYLLNILAFNIPIRESITRKEYLITALWFLLMIVTSFIVLVLEVNFIRVTALAALLVPIAFGALTVINIGLIRR